MEITVSPLTPPFQDAFETLELRATFRGVNGFFENPQEAKITAVLMADTTNTGNYTVLRAFPLGNFNASFKYVGMDTVETKFAVYLKDGWGNSTESKYYTLKPLYSAKLDKKKWLTFNLPSDTNGGGNENSLNGLWDIILPKIRTGT